MQVLDRVMLRRGGKSWWAALGARARAQRMAVEHRGGKELVGCYRYLFMPARLGFDTYPCETATVCLFLQGTVLRDLNNYSLTARLRRGIGR